MSQLVKNKRQANFKDFKRFGALKGLVEQKNVVFNYYLQNLTLQSFIDTLYMLVLSRPKYFGRHFLTLQM
jgi:hypothetical protein